MSDNYWTKRNISRRTALRAAAASGAGLAALSLIGCGGGSSGTKTTEAPATTKQATLDSTKGIPGGSFKLMLPGPITSMTIIDKVNGSAVRNGGIVFSSLLGLKWGTSSVAINDYTPEPDLALAVPEQPDQQTLIFKLRPGVKFHNGRAFTSEDVKYSATRYATAENSGYKNSWSTWLDRVETPDPQTAVIKTKFPFADAIESWTGNVDGFMLSKEHEEGPDTATKQVGTGPYTLGSAEPPVSWTYKKNPDYYNKPYPYFDEIVTYAVGDPVKRIANFTTKQVQGAWVVYADDRDYIKQQRPDALVQTNDWVPTAMTVRSDRAPMNDRRVRQALSMTIDRKKARDAVMQGQGEPDQFFPAVYAQNYGTHKVKDLGSAAKYWDYDPAEAKKLLAAAGHDKPLEFNFGYYEPAIAGQWHTDQCVLASANWKALGVAVVKEMALTGAQTQLTFVGQYDGMASYQSPTLSGLQKGANLRDQLFWGPNGEHSGRNNGYVNNADLNPLLDKQMRQFNAEECKDTFRQVEAIIAQEMYRLFFSNTTQTWYWDPSVKNASMPQEISLSTRFMMKWWYDKA